MPKIILNKETTTMKRLLLLACAAVAVHGTTWAASVYDEAKVWFRGGYDANGDGVFAAGEFVDSARPKSDTAHQTVTITGSGAAYGRGSVWSSFNPFYTNTQYYASLPNGDCAAAADCSSIKIVNPLVAGESWTNFTIFMRFRWDGKIPVNNGDGISATMIELVNTHWHWNQKKGVRFGLKYFPETDDFAPFWRCGQDTNMSNPTETKGIKLPVGEWRDIMITVMDKGAGANAVIKFYMGEAGVISEPSESKLTVFRPWISESGNTLRVGLLPTDNIRLGSEAFSGDIAAWAIWPRLLTTDEMREAFTDTRPGDALFRIGKEDGKADEFAASGREQYAIDANGTWDVVPSALDQTHGTLTINFEVPDSWNQLNQILRLVAVSGNGKIAVTVADTDRGTSTSLEARKLRPGHPADFFIGGEGDLKKGTHSLTLRLIEGSGVVFDVIEMRGSFCLGKIDYGTSPNAQFMGSYGITYYDVATGYWREMKGDISNDTKDPESMVATTVFFDVPSDLVGCEYKLHWSYNQFKEKPDTICSYLNDSIIEHNSSHDYQYGVTSSTIQPDMLIAGRNSFKLRRTHSAQWWGSIRGLRLQIQNGPPQDKTGLVIFFK